MSWSPRRCRCVTTHALLDWSAAHTAADARNGGRRARGDQVEENAARYELPFQVIFDRLRPATEDGPGPSLFQVRSQGPNAGPTAAVS